MNNKITKLASIFKKDKIYKLIFYSICKVSKSLFEKKKDS